MQSTSCHPPDLSISADGAAHCPQLNYSFSRKLVMPPCINFRPKTTTEQNCAVLQCLNAEMIRHRATSPEHVKTSADIFDIRDILLRNDRLAQEPRTSGMLISKNQRI